MAASRAKIKQNGETRDLQWCVLALGAGSMLDPVAQVSDRGEEAYVDEVRSTEYLVLGRRCAALGKPSQKMVAKPRQSPYAAIFVQRPPSFQRPEPLSDSMHRQKYSRLLLHPPLLESQWNGQRITQS